MREFIREIATERAGRTFLARLYKDLQTQDLSVDVYRVDDSGIIPVPGVFMGARLNSEADFASEVGIQITNGLRAPQLGVSS